MNYDNYCTREAAEKLVKAGIVLETEKYWYQDIHGWYLSLTATVIGRRTPKHIPAPSMAEVWRELPDRFGYGEDPPDDLFIKKDGEKCIAGYGIYSDTATDTNPTDALIDLLIWVKQRKDKL